MSRKAEWQRQHDSFVARILDLLEAYADVSNISQAKYKDDFFAIFEDAYRSHFCSPRKKYDEASGRLVSLKEQRPLVHGDQFRPAAQQRGWITNEDETSKKYRDLRMVSIWWNEWTYAWDRNPPQPRRKRAD